MNALAVGFAAFLLAAACAASDPNNPLVLFSLKKTAPAIDGDLNDECWKSAQVATGFIILGKIRKASAETEVMSCYDAERLYIAARVREPHMDKLTADKEEPWRGDCVEFFLNPAETGIGYHQFIVDSAGNRAALTRNNDGIRRVELPVEAGVKRANDFWSVELAIPFSAIQTAAPEDNRQWGINVGRERYTVAPQENSAWAALSAFSQTDHFGRLVFYSRAEVVADINYWKNSDADPLMRRLTVSGFEVAAAGAQKKMPNLWSGDPFLPDRQKAARWNCYGVAAEEAFGPRAKGEPCAAEKNYPEFYRVAMGINRGLFARSRCADAMGQLRKAAYYAGPLPAAAAAAALCARLERECVAADDELNAVFQAYGVAFENDCNKSKLAGLAERCETALTKVKGLQAEAGQGLSSLVTAMREKMPWKSPGRAELPPDETRSNADGASQRLQFAGMRFFGYDEIFDLFGAWDSINEDWNYAVGEMTAPGQYAFSGLDHHYRRLDAIGKTRRGNFHTACGAEYIMPMPPWLEAKLKSDSDLLVRSQDGLTAAPSYAGIGEGGKTRQSMQPGMNPHHPAVMEFMRDYLKHWAARANQDDRAHFFVSGWEDSNYIQVKTPKGMQKRSVGYNAGGKAAFRAYLNERYSSISELNRKWGAAYASFDAIEPPDDKYIRPPEKATGLTYEFERWGRVEHARYRAKQRQFLKEGAPRVPVMTDDSITMLEMNGYLNFRENTADVYSFHSNPSDEEAMWIYLRSLSRRFGDKPLGYYENYWAMYTRPHLADERLAKRDLRRFFFNLFMRDIRCSTWWLRYSTAPTDYLVAYGGETFRLEYDQTTVRWCATELPVMFARGRVIERALLESQPETPAAAIIQPCATIFNLASMGHTYRASPPIRQMIDLHYQLLAPGNFPHDYLPEEMVLDGKASLNEYKLLALPYAPYLSEKFSSNLQAWVWKGGVLIADGPFGLMDEFGAELPEQGSLFKTAFPTGRKTGDGFWDYSPERGSATKDPTIKVVPIGKGSLVYLNQPIDAFTRNPDLAELLRKILAARVVQTASSPSSDLKLLVREGKPGEKYLCLCNKNVEAPLQTTVTIQGKYRETLDVVFPNAFPVPTRITDGQTDLDIYLDPGDWTMLLLRPK
ncbi:MAG: beta-galactosidase [Verrucomicrobia bacterium]|nr:beta-galactosidase [Verrucomicrobiota bacterium]